MKFCEKCGTQLEDDAIVCTNCEATVKTKGSKKSKNSNKEKMPKKATTMFFIAVPLIIVITVAITFTCAYFLLPKDTVTTGSTAPAATEVRTDVTVNTVCSESDSGNHSWGSPNCINPAKCYYCDEYKDNKLGNHNWYPANCVEPAHCSHCDEYKDDKLGNHSWHKTDDGIQECEFCYMLYSDYVAKD